MNDVTIVNMRNTLQQTFHYHRCLKVLQIIFVKPLQLAARNVLHLNHQEFFILIDVFELNHVAVLHSLHDF